TAVPDHGRGALSRWMLEPVAGVYVGTMSARVRDELWSVVSASVGVGAAVCVLSDDSEEGLTIRTAGEPRRATGDFDWLQLIQLSALEEAEQDMPPVPEGW